MTRCALCHDDLAPGSEQRCEGCGTLLHPDCAAGLARCPTLGCARPLPGPPKRGSWGPWRSALAACAVVALAVVGLAALALHEWMEITRPIVERNQRRQELKQRLGIDLPTVAREARALHARLAPSAERPVTESEVADAPRLRAAASQGSIVAWEDGVVVYLGKEPYMSWAVVVLARPDAELSPGARQRLAKVHLEMSASLEELEPGVYVRTVTR